MSRKTVQRPDSAVHVAHLPGFVEALASVRAELVAIPREQVLPIGGDVDALLRLLPRIEAERVGATEEKKERLDRLELLTRAFARAHLAYLWEPPRQAIANYDHLVAKADRLFRETEEIVAQEVGRGGIARRRVPRAGGTTVLDRCQHVLRLLELLRDHDVRVAWHSFDATERVALRLLGACRAVPGELSRSEMRERAYTALHRALAEHEALAHYEDVGRAAADVPAESGVFESVALFGSTDAWSAARAHCA